MFGSCQGLFILPQERGAPWGFCFPPPKSRSTLDRVLSGPSPGSQDGQFWGGPGTLAQLGCAPWVLRQEAALCWSLWTGEATPGTGVGKEVT